MTIVDPTSPTNDKRLLTLDQIFEASSIIRHGPFKVYKPANFDISAAHFFASGRDVKLGTTRTGLMAVYVANAGRPVTTQMVAHALPKMKMPEDGGPLIRVHISGIKKAIAEQLKPVMPDMQIKAITDCIDPLNPYRGTRGGGDSPMEYRGAYRILSLGT